MPALAQVSKPVPLVREFSRLCIDVAAGSFDADSRSVDFGLLNEAEVKATALFGYNDDVWKALLDVGELHYQIAVVTSVSG